MPFIPAHLPPAQPTPLGWHFAFVGKELLLPADDGETLSLPPGPGFAAPAQACHYLGQLDGQDCWACTLDEAPPGWRAVPLRAALSSSPPR